MKNAKNRPFKTKYFPFLSFIFLIQCFLLVGCAGPQSEEKPIASKSSSFASENDSEAILASSSKRPKSKPNQDKQGGQKPNLSGTWILNPELSDNVQEKMRAAQSGNGLPKERMDGAKGGRRGSERGSKGGRGGRKGGMGYSGKRDKKLAQGFIRLPETLIIEHHDPQLALKNPQRTIQRVYTDYRSQSVSALGATNQAVTTAAWEGDHVVLETVADNMPHLERFIGLDDKLEQLNIVTVVRFKENNQEISIHTVYDRKKTTE